MFIFQYPRQVQPKFDGKFLITFNEIHIYSFKLRRIIVLESSGLPQHETVRHTNNSTSDSIRRTCDNFSNCNNYFLNVRSYQGQDSR